MYTYVQREHTGLARHTSRIAITVGGSTRHTHRAFVDFIANSNTGQPQKLERNLIGIEVGAEASMLSVGTHN